jgi:hypothetical protein
LWSCGWLVMPTVLSGAIHEPCFQCRLPVLIVGEQSSAVWTGRFIYLSVSWWTFGFSYLLRSNAAVNMCVKLCTLPTFRNIYGMYLQSFKEPLWGVSLWGQGPCLSLSIVNAMPIMILSGDADVWEGRWGWQLQSWSSPASKSFGDPKASKEPRWDSLGPSEPLARQAQIPNFCSHLQKLMDEFGQYHVSIGFLGHTKTGKHSPPNVLTVLMKIQNIKGGETHSKWPTHVWSHHNEALSYY